MEIKKKGGDNHDGCRHDNDHSKEPCKRDDKKEIKSLSYFVFFL